ncbi:MAG: isoprenylcysteine carboxylmethyltransferase family protein [Planctomycetia bacterium]|nr:isoprenylcysteine carboxylmethyltransferase family protein [Planctomycetia bacterium]
MIERVRHFFGIGSLIVLPPALLFWFLIHPWARWWRRWGPLRTYFAVVPVMAALGALLFRFRGPLLGTNLGTNWWLVTVALVLYAGVTWLEFQYWRHLSIATLVGITELSPSAQQKGSLMQEGIYGVVRHPRYLSAGVSMIANTLFINYAGLYFLVLLLVPVGYLMIVLEEQELIERFGEEYRKYQRRVPRLIPRWRKTN